MKKFFLISLVAVNGFLLWQTFFPMMGEQRTASLSEEESYIVVYGRDACPLTRKHLRALDRGDADYTYRNIDNRKVRNELFPRMEEAGLNTNSFVLPVVDVNGEILVSPRAAAVLEKFGKEPAPIRKEKPTVIVKKDSPLPKVTGIIQDAEKAALVGDQIVKRGDRVGDFIVRKIGDNFVEFQDLNGRALIQRVK